jgi:general stress protein CsbA
MLRVLRYIPGVWINLGGWLAIALCVALAAVVAFLAPYFAEEWTLWVALVAMSAGFITIARRRRPRR